MSRKFKIALMCGSNSWGGLEMNVLRLARWLRDRGHEITLYTAPKSKLAQEAKLAGFNVREIARRGKYGGFLSARRLASFVKADGVEFLLIQTNRDILISALAKSIGKWPIKLIFMQHMQIGRVKKDLIHTWEYSKLDAWISPLKILGDKVLELTRIAPEKIHIVPLGMELDRFTINLPPQRTARQQLNISTEGLIAGVVGRIDRLKGQDVLIKACSLVHRENIPLHLLFVGDRTRGESTSYTDEIERLVQQLGLTSHVTFLPHTDRIELAYAALDIFVLPSHSETYGMVTIEAMASAKPVIATNSGGTPGIISHGDNGLLVPPRDVKALAQALLMLLRNRDQANRLADIARKDALSRYSYQHTLQLLESVLEELS